MSDTPRIDAAEIRIKSTGPCLVNNVCTIDTARRIERELNAAHARIKRLEDALRRIANQDYRGNRSTESQIAFDALKEAKP